MSRPHDEQAHRRARWALTLALTSFAVGCDAESDTTCDEDCADGVGCVQDGCSDPGPIVVSGRFPVDVPAGFELTDLGEIDLLDGETPDLSFEAGEHVRSFYVVGVGPAGSFVQPLSVVSPTGEQLVEPSADVDALTDGYFAGFPGPALSPNRAVGRPRAAAVMVPNTPALAMSAGTWTFRLTLARLLIDAYGQSYPERLDGRIRVGVVARVSDPPAEGRLDVVLSFDPSSGLTAASAEDDPEVALALARVAAALEPVGVAIGEVTHRDVAGLPDPVDLGGGSCLGGDTERVFDAVDPVDGALHLVFVGAFRCERAGLDVGASLAGLSNGLPGIPFATRDGVIVATALKGDHPDEWANVVAHETGHFLGLFHTAEAIPGIHDNIPDTDDAHPADYLMHFQQTAGALSTLVTPDQGWVLRQHPLVVPGGR